MPLEISQIQPRIFFAKFDDQYKMCTAILRIEGAKTEIKKDHDNHRKYIKKYVQDTKVSGFFISSKFIRSFQKLFKPAKMAEEEKAFIKALLKAVKEAGLGPRNKFGVIACYNGQHSITFKHEMAHSMFYADYLYRMKVLRLFKKIKPEIKQKMMEYLNHNDFRFKSFETIDFIDEINALISTENVMQKAFDDTVHIGKREMDKFKKLYEDNAKSR